MFNPGLALTGFEQPGPGGDPCLCVYIDNYHILRTKRCCKSEELLLHSEWPREIGVGQKNIDPFIQHACYAD